MLYFKCSFIKIKCHEAHKDFHFNSLPPNINYLPSCHSKDMISIPLWNTKIFFMKPRRFPFLHLNSMKPINHLTHMDYFYNAFFVLFDPLKFWLCGMMKILKIFICVPRKTNILSERHKGEQKTIFFFGWTILFKTPSQSTT